MKNLLKIEPEEGIPEGTLDKLAKIVKAKIDSNKIEISTDGLEWLCYFTKPMTFQSLVLAIGPIWSNDGGDIFEQKLKSIASEFNVEVFSFDFNKGNSDTYHRKLIFGIRILSDNSVFLQRKLHRILEEETEQIEKEVESAIARIARATNKFSDILDKFFFG